jgi:hypothetical protein
MPDQLGPGTTLGYCTNVHAGASLTQMQANLERFALPVKAIVSPDAPMGVGLWLSAAAAQQLAQPDQVKALADWLGARGLQPFTFNGFPFGDFHEPVVKHRVYAPDWSDPRRLRYTRDLARILAGLLPEGAEGSISTLPVGWRAALARQPGALVAAAANLRDLVHHLARLELDTGRLIHVDLEPEPGCYLDTGAGVVSFFREHLLGTADDLSTLAYLRVCHDVCHAAVMFESQEEVLALYRAAGIRVGKVQLSSALAADLDGADPAQRRETRAQLGAFVEDRYLHQTVCRGPDGHCVFHEDLDSALAAADARAPAPGTQCRVHFHVPIFLDRIDALGTTSGDIGRCLRAIKADDQVHHFEVETYAWTVLPPSWQQADLAEGIARELQWVRQQVQAR